MNIRFTVDYRGKARRASEQATAAVFQILNARFQAALATPAYDWDLGNTIRSNGQVAGSPRNVIDTGNLRQSNTGPEINGLRAQFRWTAPYSVAVHEGALLENGTLLPARPWTGAVLGVEPVQGIEPFDLEKAFKETWLKVFNAS